MRFDIEVNNILNEIPYVDYISKFDLELETKQKADEFLNFINDIFEGSIKVDKHKNTIWLETDNDKRFFLTSLINDQVLKNWMNKLDLQDRNRVKEYFKTLSYKLSNTKPRSTYM